MASVHIPNLIAHVRRHVRAIEAVTDTPRGRVVFTVSERQAKRIAASCNTSFADAMRVAGQVKEAGTPAETALWSLITDVVSDLSTLECVVMCGADPRNKDAYIVTRDKVLCRPALPPAAGAA